MRKNSISKYWVATLELMVRKPLVILPFVVIGFLEAAALELLYFSTRPPLSAIADPIIKKFFGEAFIHYPGHLLILSKLFYYAQVALYVTVSVALMAASVNIFKNIKESLPVRADAMFKNVIKRYFGYFIYGCLIVIVLFLSNKAEMFLFSKIMAKLSALLPQAVLTALSFGLIFILFITNVVIYTLLISTIPLIAIEKKPLLKGMGLSIYIGIRDFFKIFPLILLPFLIYLPITLLKSFPNELADKTFPEINALVIFAGIIVTIFVDCFMLMCVTQWLIDNKKISSIAN